MKRIFLFLFVFSSLSLFSQQIWLTEKISPEIKKNLSLNVEFEDRFSTKLLLYTHTVLGISIKHNKLSYGIDFKTSHSNIENNDVEVKYTPKFNITYSFNKIDFSNKFEIVFADDISYKNRNKLSFKQKLKGKFYIYSSEEIFYFKTISENRFILGIIYNSDNISLTPYYMILHKNKVEWSKTDVIGISFKINKK